MNLPRAYAVPHTLPALVELLRRHAFALVPSPPDRVERIERYRVNGLTPPEPNRSPRTIELQMSTEHQPLHDYLLLSAAAGGGRLGRVARTRVELRLGTVCGHGYPPDTPVGLPHPTRPMKHLESTSLGDTLLLLTLLY